MKHKTTPDGAIWSHDSRALTLACLAVITICASIALWSVELIGISCDRAEDRCELINVTLLEGRAVREVLLSEVVSFDRNYSISSRRSRSQVYTTEREQPVLVLTDGTSLELKRRERKLAMKSDTFIELEAFLADRSATHFQRRDFFSGWWLPLSLAVASLFFLALLLGTRAVRLEISHDAKSFRFKRLGLFSPARHEGSLNELRACIIQNDPQTPSPGVYLHTTRGEWLALTFQGGQATAAAIMALRQLLERADIATLDAYESGSRPKLDATWVFVGLLAGALAGVSCAGASLLLALWLTS